MHPAWKLLYRAASLALGLAALLAAHTWFFKPLSIDWFYARSVAQFALDREGADLTRATLATLLRYDREDLDREGQLAYDTFDYVLSMQLEGAALRQGGAQPLDPAYYAWCVRWYTATELTPQQAHALSLAEVERLEAHFGDVTKRADRELASGAVPGGMRRVSGGPATLSAMRPATAETQRMTWARRAIRVAAQRPSRTADFAAYRGGLVLYTSQTRQGAEPEEGDDRLRLRAAMQHAARGVVDSGIHELGWTREQAQDYLLAYGAPDADAAAGAVEHILAHPGEALAAPVGLRKLLELRDKAAAALGAEFDHAQFHREMHRHGALPFSVLDSAIDAWIARRQAAAEPRRFVGG